VGHNIELIKELKTHTLNRFKIYKKLGYIVDEKYDELVKLETEYIDSRIRTMESFL
jgi:hypothetical protein